ncbi:MAG: hypothetical protein HND47_20655 [Chloroflexi bacterium]|nr:hypothetical protein [Chloroflexota bacterium]NOH04208.1 hypothetical protein [Chloroflexota bacterium]
MVEIDIIQLLKFYDEKIQTSVHHATAINAVAGEDLGAGLITHYLNRGGFSAKVLPDPCTQKTKKGHRLDRWILATIKNERVYYQTEIKNWSAHAIGGKILKINATQDEVFQYKIIRWHKTWNGKTLTEKTARKVLTPMKPVEENSKVEPLICFWMSMHPEGKNEPFFSVDIKNKNFSKLWVFSMSAYLRNLLNSGKKKVTLEMPDTESRIKWLKTLFRVK